MSHISQLPPEVLYMIFTYLSDVRDRFRVCRVCVSWRDVAYLRQLWKNVTVRLSNHRALDCTILLDSFVHRGVRHVRVDDPFLLMKVSQSIHNLESLDLTNCFMLTDTTLSAAFRPGTLLHLCDLTLDRCNSITDEGVKSVSLCCSNLDTLSLDFQGKLTDLSLASIAVGMGKLKHLRIVNCDLVTDAGIGHLSGWPRFPVNGRCPQLELLMMDKCYRLTDTSLHYLRLGQQRLEFLQLEWGQNFTDDGMTYLAEMSRLRSLSLSGCPFSDEGLAHLAEGGSNVVCLDLSDSVISGGVITNAGLAHLTKLQQLQCLSVCNSQVDDDGLAHLVKKGAKIICLNICLCNVTDAVFQHLAKLVELRDLFVSDDEIGDNGLAHLVEGGSKIIKLYIDSCHRVSDDGLMHLSRLPNLTYLSLRNCSGITDQGLIVLVERLIGLTLLDIEGCEQISARALEHVAGGMTKLRTLYLDRSQVTDEGMKLATRNLRSLRALFVDDSNIIDEITKLRIVS